MSHVKNRNNKVVFLSYFFSVMMVVYHSDASGVYAIDGGKDFWYYFDQWLNSFGRIGLTWFFICSGYLLYYNLNSGNIRKKIQNRVLTLGILLLLWNCIGWLYNLVKLYLMGMHESLGVIAVRFIFSDYDPVMWFLQSLLMYLILLPIIVKVFHKKLIGLCIIAITYLAVKFSGIPTFASINGVNIYVARYFSYLPMYLLGAWFGIQYPNIIRENDVYPVTIRWGAVLLSVAVWAAHLWWGFIDVVQIIPLLIWVALPVFPNGFRKVNTFVNNSFFIYAAHIFALGALKKISLFIWNGTSISTLEAVVIRLTYSITTIILLTLAEIAIIKICPRVFGTLSGGRG